MQVITKKGFALFLRCRSAYASDDKKSDSAARSAAESGYHDSARSGQTLHKVNNQWGYGSRSVSGSARESD